MIDILENDLYKNYPEAFALLLKDQTTQRNILWATHDYEYKGDGYLYNDQILPQRITGVNGGLIKPRVLKGQAEQSLRTKSKAEIFTPSWVCNMQNNIADESWFGRKDAFNHEDLETKTWHSSIDPIVFPKNKDWKDYIAATRMEVTCGEAPYLVSRYDTTSGEFIALKDRIGLLDRKLRIVDENTTSSEDWIYYTERAYKSIYGFEWQGDSLLLARESLLISFIEYYEAKFNSLPDDKDILKIAFVISWNLWQMDGLKFVVPDTCHATIKPSGDLFDKKAISVPCEGCATNDVRKHNGIYCLIKNWEEKDDVTGIMGKSIRFVDLLKR